MGLPNCLEENKNVKLYAEAMKQVCLKKQILFIDVFTPTLEWFNGDDDLTIDGSQFNEKRIQKICGVLSL